MEVNQEINSLKSFMRECEKVLLSKARLVIISYHSLEDRIVKRFTRHGVFDKEPIKDMYGNVDLPFRQITRKPIVPTEREILNNNRARSARLRVAEKL